jgi:hypothetical protein
MWGNEVWVSDAVWGTPLGLPARLVGPREIRGRSPLAAGGAR